jgi:hyaluronan synthase
MSPKIRPRPPLRRGGPLDRALRGISVLYLVVLLAAIIAYKAVFVGMLTVDPWFTLYGIVVCAYIVTRFMLSLFYSRRPTPGWKPRVAIVMPGFNEEAAIAGSLRSLLGARLPRRQARDRGRQRRLDRRHARRRCTRSRPRPAAACT